MKKCKRVHKLNLQFMIYEVIDGSQFFFYLEYTTSQFEKRCEIFHKNNRYTAFVLADVKRVKPASINAFRSYWKTRFQNAFFSQKFTPWVVNCNDSIGSSI